LLPEAAPVAIVKCGGMALDEYYVADGTLLENTDHPNLCRTQARVRLDSSVRYFLKNPLANHHLLVLGDYGNLLHEFFQSNSCKRIE
jgi:L-fucose isomerase-like protein